MSDPRGAIDARSLDAREIACDVCIVGAGAAGITLARELIGHKAEVCLLESGGLTDDDETHELTEGQVEGDVKPGYAAESRSRFFGGSTNCWGGMCPPLDPIDFEAKPWLEHSVGWPFARAELVPFYRRAAALVEMPAYEDLEVEPQADDDLETRLMRFSPPTRFGEKYRAELFGAPNLTTLLHANAREFVPDPEGTHIDRLRVVTGNQREITVRAKRFVLATGGLENPRILLDSNGVMKAGVGNGADLVGRYFMAHSPLYTFASGMLTEPRLISRLVGPTHGSVRLGARLQREHRLLNVGFDFTPIQLDDDTARIFEAVARISPGSRKVQAFNIGLVIPEPSPHPTNRVTLTDERDALGMRRLRLHYVIDDGDIVNVDRSFRLLALRLGLRDAGRLKPWQRRPDSILPDQHHLGATRMHASARLGVVDPDCRVHGIDNLYIAGSSVFPAAGWANPTLTIVALAVRLADRLKRELA